MSEKEQVEKEKSKLIARPFPKFSLEESLRLPKIVQDSNNGKPMKALFIAKALDMSSQSTNFRDITSASYKYGLTLGTVPNVETISLTPLGSALTKPIDPIKEVKDRQEAVMNIPVFKTVFEHYRNGKFPSGDNYFKNMLEDTFKVPRKYIDECLALLQQNGKFANIFTEMKGNLYVSFSDEPIATPEMAEETATEVSTTSEEELEGQEPEIRQPEPQKTMLNQIFIIHGKDLTPVEQLKKILQEFKIPFKVAVDEPNKGRPIPKKVSDLMKACTSAIVIFTADEEYSDAKGDKFFRPSDNAVYELGAASILYEDKIVILKEENVTLSSDFSDLGHISFRKDELDAKSMQLIKELIGFGLLKFTPA